MKGKYTKNRLANLVFDYNLNLKSGRTGGKIPELYSAAEIKMCSSFTPKYMKYDYNLARQLYKCVTYSTGAIMINCDLH